MWFRAIRTSGCPILFWRFGSEDKTQPVKISPCSLLRYNAEEPVARKEHPFVGSQARSIGLIMFPAKFEAVNSNGKQGRQTKRLRASSSSARRNSSLESHDIHPFIECCLKHQGRAAQWVFFSSWFDGSEERTAPITIHDDDDAIVKVYK
ncbi:hypothetical protein YC2023_018127 [Brassica napus]